MKKTGADITVEYLERTGITHILIVLGSAVFDLMDSLHSGSCEDAAIEGEMDVCR